MLSSHKIEVTLSKFREIYHLGERVIFQYIITNSSSEAVILRRIENAIPYGFIVNKTNIGGVVGYTLVFPNLSGYLSPYKSVTIFIEATASSEVSELIFMPCLIAEGGVKINVGPYKYSIIDKERLSTFLDRESYKDLQRGMQREYDVIELLEAMGVHSIDVENLISSLLPLNFSYMVHENGLSKKEVKVKTVGELAEKLISSDGAVMTLITGPSLIGKTTFAATLLYQIYKKEAKNGVDFIVFSLRGRRKRFNEILNDVVRDKFKEEGVSSFKKLLEHCKLSGRRLYIWVDVDYYKNSLWQDHIIELISVLSSDAKGFTRLFLIADERKACELLEGVDIKEYNLIRIHHYTKQQAIKIAMDEIGSDNDMKEIITKAINYDRFRRFTKPPYLRMLIKNAKSEYSEVLKGSKYSHLRLIVKAIYDLLLELYQNIPEIKNILDSEYYSFSESFTKDPEMFRPGNPIAIDYEADFVVSRSVEDVARAKFHDEHTKILIISGLASSGKTTLALKLGYQMLSEGNFVYFISSAKMEGFSLQALKELTDRIYRDVIIIVDDSHLDVKKLKLGSILNAVEYSKIIITERSNGPVTAMLTDFIRRTVRVQTDTRYKLAKLVERKEVAEVFISEADFNEVVMKILKHTSKIGYVSFDIAEIDRISRVLINKARGILYLLRFIFNYFYDKNLEMTLKRLETFSLKDAIENYLDAMIEELDNLDVFVGDIRELLNGLLFYLALFSQYEIPVSHKFLFERLSLFMMFDEEDIAKLLHHLLAWRELTKIKIRGTTQYLLPHATFAQCLIENIEVPFLSKIDESTEIFALVLSWEASLSLISRKLYLYNSDLLKSIAHLCVREPRIRSKILQEPLHEINDFLFAINHVDRAVAKDVIAFVKDEIVKEGKISQSSLFDLRELICNLSYADELIAGELLNKIKVELKEKIKSASLGEVADFLYHVTWTSKEIARRIVETLKGEINWTDKFVEASLIEIGDFFRSISWADKVFANEIAIEVKNILLNKKDEILKASLRDIGSFFAGLNAANKEISYEVAEAAKDSLSDKEKFLYARIDEIGKFFSGLAWANRTVAEEVAKDVLMLLKDKHKIKQASIKDIASFISGLAWVSGDITKEVILFALNEIKEKIAYGRIEDVAMFFSSLNWVSQEISVLALSCVKDELRKRIVGASLDELLHFFRSITNSDFLFEVLRYISKELKEKISQESLSNVVRFIEDLLNNVRWASDMIIKCIESELKQKIIENKEAPLSKRLLNLIKKSISIQDHD